jgi:N12 class adenine-specific DNA methylase
VRSTRAAARRQKPANIRAIELVHQIEAAGRPATAAEQADLARYVGWGGIKNAFPDAQGAFADDFEDIGARLRELLSDDEYNTARRSIQYAHYTAEDVVRSMWDAVVKMGFEGGQVFEPGMGVGNFAGMMPQDIAANTHYQGVELDHTTARIAKLLYPKYGVRQDDFTKTKLPENSYDLVIGNPPFADVAIKSDPKYKQGFLLHDYFFAKSLDAVRPGGLLAFVTSAGTMNKLDTAARDYLADRADLVGAIRLPGDAFAKNAGTFVTTDIIFLRKRLPGDIAGDRSWTETAAVSLPGKQGMVEGNVNRYFAEHPEMVLGKADFNDKLYAGRYSVKSDGSDLKANLAKAIDSLPAGVMSPWADVNAEHHQHDFDTTEKKEGTYYVGPDGALHQVTNGVGQKVGQRGKGVENGRTAAEMERIKGLIPIRDALRQVYAADLKGDTPNAERARAALNKAYDTFTKAFGPINKAVIQTRRPNVIQMEAARDEAREAARYAGEAFREGSFDATKLIEAKTPASVIARKRQEARDEFARTNQPFDEGDFDIEEVPDVIIDKRPNVDPFMDDPESYRLRAIEKYDEGTGIGHKSDVFSKNIVTREVVPKIKSVNDGLLYSLSQYGRVNIPAIAELVKRTEAQVIEELAERVFKTPGTKDSYQTRDEYLSGNVRKKLELAQRAADRNPEFRRNVEALEASQPMPLAPSQIHANLGMPWIPQATIEKFGRDELGLESLKVRYTSALASWTAAGDTDSVAARSTWGTEDRRAPALLQDALNRQSPKIYDKYRDADGREVSVLNVAKTEAANDKMMQIREKFAGWIWADQERADTLAAYYNETYNNLVVREYNGDYLTTPGIASDWSWRPHQKRVIARIIQSGNTYVAHAVGAGKTSEYIGAIMEMRRLGLVRKPMVAVPNHMLAQFTKEWYHQYPTARLAIADEKRFHTDRRKQFIANVALDDLDAVIITHSSFGMIPVSAEFENGIIQAEIPLPRGAGRAAGRRQSHHPVPRSKSRSSGLSSGLSARRAARTRRSPSRKWASTI